MSNSEAATVAVIIIVAIGVLFAVGMAGLVTAAWVSYRHDGGKDGLIKWLSEI